MTFRFQKIMNLFIILTLILLFLSNDSSAQEDELRGVWIAWAGSNVPSKERIAHIMADVARHHLNTVYVDVWRFGYPYFRSEVFHQLTGYQTDPNLADGRDVLAEMIAEGHRHGLHVEAWFEYGFVTCQGDIEHVYKARPEWFARRRNGSVLFNGDYRYKWLSHCNPEAQQFLIDLCLEAIKKYDIDGIELDRIRYPELDCGYDSVTIALYKKEYNDSPPPQNVADSRWMRWRAQKLTEFAAAFYDSVKAIRPELPVSNAPIVYPYGYDNFCQDWRPWVNEGHLDIVIPQVYRPSNARYLADLLPQMSYTHDLSKFYPGITTIFDTYLVPTSELVAKIKTTRQKNLKGHVIWFYDTLTDDLPALKNQVYQQKVNIPNRPADWRRPAIIIHENDSLVQKSNGWTEYTGIAGLEGGCFYVKSDQSEWIEYNANIPQAGWYEVYCFTITHWNATTRAAYQIIHQNGIDTVFVDQTKTGHARWYKIGDFYFNNGHHQTVLRLTNENVGDHLLFTDAIMLLNTNRPVRYLTQMPEKKSGTRFQGLRMEQNYPNPFNPRTTIQIALVKPEHVRLRVFNLNGKEIRTLVDQPLTSGEHSIIFEANDLASGIYICKMQAGHIVETKKMVLVR